MKENHADFKGEKHPMYGKKHKLESRIKISNAKKGSIPWNKGKKLSIEHGEKIGKANSLRNVSMYTREKMSKAQKGKGVKKVICLNNNQIFESIKDATKYMGLKNTGDIPRCCKGQRKSAGKINGEPARWMYYDDYLNMKNKEAR